MKRKGIVIGVSVVIILLSVVLYLKINDSIAFNIDSNSKKIELQQQVSLSSIKIPGYKEIYIPANKEDIQLALVNPQDNGCYFKFDLILDDEKIYSSDYVQSGYEINEIKLKHGLDRGEYLLNIKVTPYTLDKSIELNSANVKTKLIVY